MDVLQRDDLPFPRSLPEFQQLFPDEAKCAAYMEKARLKIATIIYPAISKTQISAFVDGALVPGEQRDNANTRASAT